MSTVKFARMADGQTRITDGQLSYLNGVDSSRPTTIAGPNMPDGLARNALSWANNCVERGGGITQRTGYAPVCTIRDSTGLYQGGWMYDQPTGIPYLIVAISGRFYRIRLDTDNSVEDITGSNSFPAAQPFYHFAQGLEFLVVQSGDYTTLPLFWDGNAMRQSVGIIGPSNTPVGGVLPYNELPAAGSMVYYQGRIWYSYFTQYTGGDIVRGSSGTAPYQLRDSILKVTENPLAIGGDGFAVPSQAGNIRALQYAANNDKTLGEGTLFVFTAQQVHAIDVPITRADWIAASSNTPPNQRPVQRENGGVNDRSVVAVNGDLFYQSLDPAIRSLFTALRYFNQWGNTPISNNIDRALAFNDRELMRYGASGIEFDNYLYQAILPEQRPQGVVGRGLAVLDFNPVATLQEKLPPAWCGVHEGLDILQLFKGDFGGRKRAFAVVVSRVDDSIQLWEITNNLRFDNVDTRVKWYVEFPAYTWGREFDLKKLDGGELWLDKLFGTVDLKFYYRNDGNPCWQFWHAAKFCTARTSCETVDDPACYPTEPLREGGKFPITLPIPPLPPCDSINARPMNIGHQFQMKVEVEGWCRIRGDLLYALPVLKQPFEGLQSPPGPLSLTTVPQISPEPEPDVDDFVRGLEDGNARSTQDGSLRAVIE